MPIDMEWILEATYENLREQKGIPISATISKELAGIMVHFIPKAAEIILKFEEK